MTVAIFVAGVVVGLVFAAIFRKRAPRMASTSVPGIEAIRERAENAERDALSRLESFFAPDAARGVLENPRSLDPKPMQVAVLVIAVRGWTEWCEGKSPQEVAPRLNEILDPIVRCALRNHGTIDKFLGAGALVFFGAPMAVPDAPAKAIAAAREMTSALSTLARPAQASVGLAYGEVAAGTFGASVRLEYTVAGDVVNVASALAQHDGILASDAIVSAANAQGGTKAGAIAIPSRAAPVEAWRLG